MTYLRRQHAPVFHEMIAMAAHTVSTGAGCAIYIGSQRELYFHLIWFTMASRFHSGSHGGCLRSTLACTSHCAKSCSIASSPHQSLSIGQET